MNYSKIVSSTKRISTIFLTIILLTGTIAAISPSFIIGAQADSYYGIDDRYDSYEPTEYPSYKPDYKPEYPSDNNYKSKKDSNISVSLNKLNCINNNVNINGNNTGDINVGNSGSSETAQGYLGVGSSEGSNDEGYDNGYNKQKDKGFECIINNNNINNNFGTGNATDGNVIEPLTCEECFSEFLTQVQLTTLEAAFDLGGTIIIIIGGQQITVESLEDLCNELQNATYQELLTAIIQVFDAANVDVDEEIGFAIVLCIAEALDIPIPTPIPR